MTELATSFGDLFLKVADLQFKYVKKKKKKMLEKEKIRRDILRQQHCISAGTVLSSRFSKPSRGVFTQANVLQ